ncbi:TetR/AcrR family transcriptional regulator [Streptomyces sp. NPDC047071]|uniref:TetR/AcrR family transcriptional regulator n=1 Tax=Streptomyces sp. NPDC047071 TaxID=3154808 RepID=UPI00345416A7
MPKSPESPESRESPSSPGTPVRKARADAARNREAVLAAADALFARSESPRGVSMDQIAAAAGVGKGTLFRRFGDRDGLIRAVFDARSAALRAAVESGPAPLGPDTPARERVPALLDALLGFKLDNRPLALALEEPGGNSPYRSEHYAWWHGVLRDALAAAGGVPDPGYAAHALLAAVRADLVEHLAAVEGLTARRQRERLAAYVANVLP